MMKMRILLNENFSLGIISNNEFMAREEIDFNEKYNFF
jgi:hypothetical protein